MNAKEKLRKEYIAMGKDEEQDEMMKHWEDTVGDGIDEETDLTTETFV